MSSTFHVLHVEILRSFTFHVMVLHVEILLIHFSCGGFTCRNPPHSLFSLPKRMIVVHRNFIILFSHISDIKN